MARLIIPSTRLTNGVSVECKIVRFITGVYVGSINNFLEYIRKGVSTKEILNFSGARGYFELNLEVSYFKVLSPHGEIFIEIEISDENINYLLQQTGFTIYENRLESYRQYRLETIELHALNISYKTLGDLSLIRIQDISIPAGQRVDITLHSSTKAIVIYEEGITNFQTVGNARFLDVANNTTIPIAYGIPYPIGNNFSLKNVGIASINVKIMELG
jgi:hypothetical protein